MDKYVQKLGEAKAALTESVQNQILQSPKYIVICIDVLYG